MSSNNPERRAVVDRIEDGRHAVLIVDNGEERIVPASQLPEGAGEGTWLRVRFDNDGIVTATIDAEETERARARIHEKMDALRKRGRRSKN